MSDLVNALTGANRSSSVLGAIANPTQVNPLAAYGAAAETAGRIYQVQGLQAEKAWGAALQQATDPQTGQVDVPRAQAIAAADPLARMGMLKALPTTSSLQNEQLARSGATLTQYAQAGATLANDPSDANVNATFDNLKAAGFPSKTNLDTERTRVLAMSPQQRQAYGIQHSMAGLDGLQRWQQTLGTQGIMQMPQGAVPYTQKPILQGGGVSTSSGTVPAGLSGADLDRPFSYTDENGQSQTTTWRKWAEAKGIPLPNISPPQGATGGTSGLPDSLRNPANKPTPATTTPATTTPASTTPPQGATGPAPGMAEKWKASADQYTADTAAAGQYQQRIFPLVQSRALLESGDVTTGPGAETWQHLKGLLTTSAGQFGWNPNAVNNAKGEELNKYLTQYTNALPMAGASDARLASAITGNPSMHISTMANKDVVKALIGLERMKQTAVTDFANSGGQPAQYADYLRTWQNTHDPRAFVFDMLDADARKKMVAGMKTDTERSAFARTLDLVERNPGVMGQAAMPQR